MNHWELMKSLRPELSEKVSAWRGELTAGSSIPPKYQEMMKLCMACVLRFPAAITDHGKAAMKAGASREEIFDTLALSMMLGGIPAYRESATLLGDLLMEQK